MYHFIGICISNGIPYYRIFDSDTKTASDISRDGLLRELMSDKNEPIRNIGFGKHGDIVGTCGTLRNYGIQNNDTRQLRNAYVVVFKRENRYVLVDMHARLYYVNELEAIVLNESVGIANAKVVTRNGRSYLCAINGTFVTDGITDSIVEKRNKYLSMADKGSLSKRNLDRLDKATDELNLREKGYRDSLRGKIGPNLSDRIFMMPVTSNLNNIEKNSDKAMLEVKKRLIKNKLKAIRNSLVALDKRRFNRERLKGFEDRLQLLKNSFVDVIYMEDSGMYQHHEVIKSLELIMNRANMLYDDIVETYTYLTVKA